MGRHIWVKGRIDPATNIVYGTQRPDGYFDYEVDYVAGPGDLAWMEQCDRHYLARLLREGTLQHQEPDVMAITRKWSELKIEILVNGGMKNCKLPEPETSRPA